MRIRHGLGGTAALFILCAALSAAESPAAPAAKEPRNVILMIGDGMGLVQLSAAKLQKGFLAVENMKHAGFNFTHSARNFVTDSSAAATALATGYLTTNGLVGVTVDGVPLKTSLEYAEEEGKWTGLVVTCRVTHATPASMVSHVLSRGSEEDIALQIAKSNVEVILGGGWDMFLPKRELKVRMSPEDGEGLLIRAHPAAVAAEKQLIGPDGKPYGIRKDGRDLIADMVKAGYRSIRTPAELTMVGMGPPTKVLGLFHSSQMPKVSEGRSPSLSAMSLAALRILSQGPKGFFLMIEGSQIDWGGHANDFSYAMTEAADFDDAIGTVLEFLREEGIEGETLVVVTADHETGGLSLTANGTLPLGVEPKWSTTGHTGTPVPIFSSGPWAEKFSGVQSHETIGRSIIEAVSSKPVQFAYPPDKALPVPPPAPPAPAPASQPVPAAAGR